MSYDNGATVSFFNIAIKPPPIDWSPIATLAVFACIGSYIGATTPTPRCFVLFALTATISLSVLGLVFEKKHRFNLLALVVLLLFYGRSSVATARVDPQWAIGGEGDIVTLTLHITSSPITQKKTEGEMSQFDHQKTITRFTAIATPPRTKTKKAVVDVVCKEPVDVCVGDTVSVTGWLQIPTNINKNIIFYIIKNNAIQITKKIESKATFKKSVRSTLLLGLDPPQTTLARALFFGVRDVGWKKIIQTFQHAGMSHILAISGMHVAILLLFVSVSLKKLPIQKTTAILFVFLATGALAHVIDVRAPVIRAMSMVVLFLLFKLIGFRSKPISLLAISAILMLLISPGDAGTAGFQLSYAVVGAIVILLPQLKWYFLGPLDVNAPSLKMAKRWAASLWITGACAWFVATPISARLFGTIAPVGLLSSVPSIALLCTILSVGVTKTIFGYLLIGAQIPTTILFSFALSSLTETARSFGSLPLAHFQGVNISWFLALVLVLIFFTIILARKRKKTSILILGICVCVEVGKTGPQTNATVITTINVGHGTCHIIQNNGEALVIDAGSRTSFDIGFERIVPALRRLGVTTINTFVITHSDIDHICGIIDIAKTISIEKLIIAKQTAENQTKPLKLVLKKINEEQIKILERSSGWSERIGSATITMLSPAIHEKHRTTNAHSIVLLLETNNRAALFTGDIDEKKITELSEQLPSVVDIMELPHHGQWSLESQNLVHTKTPKILIQSTSIARHSKDGWTVPTQSERFVTAIDGTITSKIHPSGKIEVLGSRHPATMPRCLFYN
ncbi:MAG: ComEC/Rec2 family competence protein [Planctomycetes bacterium]|nr:ComEC/Rec2 family competence protein [Planctomycetota bacterium]